MKKLNKVEAELNTVRVALYEETKDMSPSEITAYMKAKVAPLHEKYGMRPVRQVTPDNQKAAL
jgi:hypothetical protein